MADFNPELQAKLDELEQELEVRGTPHCFTVRIWTDHTMRRREISQRKGKTIV